MLFPWNKNLDSKWVTIFESGNWKRKLNLHYTKLFVRCGCSKHVSKIRKCPFRCTPDSYFLDVSQTSSFYASSLFLHRFLFLPIGISFQSNSVWVYMVLNKQALCLCALPPFQCSPVSSSLQYPSTLLCHPTSSLVLPLPAGQNVEEARRCSCRSGELQVRNKTNWANASSDNCLIAIMYSFYLFHPLFHFLLPPFL